MQTSEILEAALGYGRRGWPVFPCDPRSKRPLTEHGFKDASIDEAQIRKWWSRHPGALIGVAMGRASGVWAVDPDGIEEDGEPDGIGAWRELVERNGCPATHTHQTPSGGQHVLFKWRADRPVTNSKGGLPAGVDVRGEGGYLIMPPSVRSDGKQWEYIGGPLDCCHPAEAPDWLHDLIETKPDKTAKPNSSPQPEAQTNTPAEPKTISERAAAGVVGHGSTRRYEAYGKAALEDEVNAVARASKGDRNNTLNASALKLGHLVPHMLDEAIVRSRLLDAAGANGLIRDDGEQAALNTIKSGLDKGKLEPKWPPERERVAAEPSTPDTGLPIFSAAELAGTVAPPRQFHVDELIPARTVTLLNGDGGTGKSLLALQCRRRFAWPGSACRLSAVPLSSSRQRTTRTRCTVASRTSCGGRGQSSRICAISISCRSRARMLS
jgi:hypothetical protein